MKDAVRDQSGRTESSELLRAEREDDGGEEEEEQRRLRDQRDTLQGLLSPLTGAKRGGGGAENLEPPQLVLIIHLIFKASLPEGLIRF